MRWCRIVNKTRDVIPAGIRRIIDSCSANGNSREKQRAPRNMNVASYNHTILIVLNNVWRSKESESSASSGRMRLQESKRCVSGAFFVALT